MRFDDSLATVLAGDTGTAVGAAAAWRQLVDLIGRRRVSDVEAAIARLRDLRARVPAQVRGASGRALALGDPPAALVALFAGDELAVAAPVLRTVILTADEWLPLLPSLSPAARAVLRHRRDLPGEVVRGLESFGATDFVLGHDGIGPAIVERVVSPAAAAPDAEPTPEPRSEIADLVARIDAFRRERPVVAAAPPPPVPADRFQFHTDAAGVFRWVEGVARAPLIGVALTRSVRQGLVTVGPEAVEAWRMREAFREAALSVEGDSSAAGRWRLAGEPRFDPATGQFTGFAGLARRVVAPPPAASAADSLRQLVHELRTPTNAITGFAELIGSELLGPVAPVYRDRAALIHRQGAALAEAIADLDTAARIEGDVLDPRAVPVDLVPLVGRAVADLQPAAATRYVRLTLQAASRAEAISDDRAARRLVERLLAAALAAAMPGEPLLVQLVAKTRSVRLHVTRPRALPAGDDRLLAIDEGERDDELLPLGVGFTLRLVRSLAAALGGALAIGADRLTLRLPAAVTTEMEQAAAR